MTLIKATKERKSQLNLERSKILNEHGDKVLVAARKYQVYRKTKGEYEQARREEEKAKERWIQFNRNGFQ